MSELVKVSIEPDPHVLQSYFHAGGSWKKVLGEWVDNAFDAGAKSISFEFDARSLRITDDGIGCEDPVAMLRLGVVVVPRPCRDHRHPAAARVMLTWAHMCV